MSRLNFVWMRASFSTAVALVGAIGWMAMAPMGAEAASLAAGKGFDPATLPPVDLVIDVNTPYFGAGSGAVDVELSGSTDLCILVGASTACQPGTSVAPGTAAPISFLVTVTVSAIHTPAISGPFTLMLTDLSVSSGALGYPRSGVTVDVAPAAIPGLDTTLVPGFSFDPNHGVNGFTPFVVVQDDIHGPGNEQYYVGWTVMMGDSVTFKYNLEAGSLLSDVPVFSANAVSAVVPEPGTALLMGLGLIGLSSAARRKG